MPSKTQLSAEVVRHIASRDIGILSAKKKYRIGESRVLRIRQGLETIGDAELAISDAEQARIDAEKARAEARRARAVTEQLRAELQQWKDEEDRLDALWEAPRTAQSPRKRIQELEQEVRDLEEEKADLQTALDTMADDLLAEQSLA